MPTIATAKISQRIGLFKMKKILIIEDDIIIANSMQKHLLSWSYDVKIIKDFTVVLDEFKLFSPHLILLDISLPFKNGYSICEEIRKTSNVPIIFISSANENMNIVLAMNMGGDDFIAKPFDLEVLTAKIQAILRRSYDFIAEQRIISLKGVTLDLENAVCSYHENSTELTKNEFVILKTLMLGKAKIISRDEIMSKLWSTDVFIDDNTLTVNITRLRKKLSDIGVTNFIETRKNLGYVIND